MKYANLLIICASLVLSQLEMGAARATDRGIDPSLYSKARIWNLTEDILNEMWRTKSPYIVTTRKNSGEVITETYELSPNGRNILRSTEIRRERRYPVAGPQHSIQAQENADFVSNQLRQLASVFNNPFLNPVGFGFPDFNIFKNFIPYGPNQFIPPIPGAPCNCPRSNEPNPEYSPPRGDPIYAPNRDSLFVPTRVDPSLNGRNPEYLPPSRPGDIDQWMPSPVSTPRTLVPRPTLAPPNFDDSNPLWVPSPDPTSTERTLVPLPTLAPKANETDTVIDDFLSKVDITVADIKEDGGEYATKIVDKQGRVLNVNFALSNDKEGSTN
ncbi:uncharacterized protein LOC108033356 [Drosophila biarmipes]|uniref:uncharacterized protein LOC108033356 n=1 Tax=Drosophila biarmipes TaxID=125945 RepID=UPI0007E5E7CF|nr:uncharacterized protein LOC108033356 [Drosophila biarmipes]